MDCSQRFSTRINCLERLIEFHHLAESFPANDNFFQTAIFKQLNEITNLALNVFYIALLRSLDNISILFYKYYAPLVLKTKAS